MSFSRKLILGALVVFFIAAKAWVFRHPKGTIAVIVAALLLIISEPAEANG